MNPHDPPETHSDERPAPVWVKLLMVAFPLLIVVGLMILESRLR